MARQLLIVSAMKYLKLIFLLLAFSAVLAAQEPAQEPAPEIDPQGIVESIEISGVPADDISQAVRGMMQRLVGQKLDQEAADDLLDRVQIELPGFIATTRLTPGGAPGRIKVIFVVEKSNEEPGQRSNINSRYTVENVEIQGIDESRISNAVRDDMRQLIGRMLDQEEANRIQRQLRRELQPRYSVGKRVVRGRNRQQVVVIYEVRKTPLIRFQDASPYLVYHSKQNASFGLDIPVSLGKNRFTLGFVNDADQLIERFAGYRAGYENVHVGTERLGLSLRYSSFHERWQPVTSSLSQESAGAPGIYRERRAFDPSITFAFDPRLKLTAGVSLSELQIQYPSIHSENANAAVASLNFQRVWDQDGRDKHEVDAGYGVRAGAHNLDSEFIYTRHFGRARYAYQHENNKLTISVMGGSISGNAPLFERFSLGNTSTLRGWNKFDIAPLGGGRVIHATLQYGFGDVSIGQWTGNTGQTQGIESGFHAFYDTGAVGDRGAPMKARHSVGLGFGEEAFFFSIAFPVRSQRIHPTFIMGVRF